MAAPGWSDCSWGAWRRKYCAKRRARCWWSSCRRGYRSRRSARSPWLVARHEPPLRTSPAWPEHRILPAQPGLHFVVVVAVDVIGPEGMAGQELDVAADEEHI